MPAVSLPDFPESVLVTVPTPHLFVLPLIVGVFLVRILLDLKTVACRNYRPFSEHDYATRGWSYSGKFQSMKASQPGCHLPSVLCSCPTEHSYPVMRAYLAKSREYVFIF